MSLDELSKALDTSKNSISMIESGASKITSTHKLKLWIRALGLTPRLNEVYSLYRRIRTNRSVYYQHGHEANEHIDRILEAYENNELTEFDIEILRTVATSQYKKA